MSKAQITGWVLSALLGAFLILGSGLGKFREFEGKAEMFEHLGYTADVIEQIGMVEIVITLMFLIPRTSFVGSVLLTAYLGGATATHVRVGDPFFAPIIIGVMVWIALGLRRPEIFEVAFVMPRKRLKDELPSSPDEPSVTV